MPLYEILHSWPFTDAQQVDLAQRITSIHTTLFTVPAGLVHVRFTNYAATAHFMGGKKFTGNMNLVIANVRPGPSRTQDQYESLCRQIEAAWTACVGSQDAEQSRFTGVFVHGALAAVYENGFMAPQAGYDGEWMRKNLPAFQALADEGNVFFQDMLAEARGREDFKSAFEPQ